MDLPISHPVRIVKTVPAPGVRAVAFALALCGLAGGCATGGSGGRTGNVYPVLTGYPVVVNEPFAAAESLGAWSAADPARWQWSEGRVVCRSENDSHADLLLTNTVFSSALAEASIAVVSEGAGAAGLVVHATPDFAGWKSGSALFAALGADGGGAHYAVFRQAGGVVGYLVPWTRLPDRATGAARMGVFTRGANLQFYLDGVLLWEGRAPGFDKGWIGFFGSASPGSTSAHAFDDLVVRVREDGPDTEQEKEAPKSTRASRAKRKAGDAKEDLRADALLGADRSPLLRPGFVVRISVLASGKREIDSEVKRVSDNYQLDLPLIGTVGVEGATLTSLIADLQARYKEYFINPQVVAEFVVEDRADAVSPWGAVVVLGRVRSPGKVNIPPTQDLTVSGAIQQAGGLDTSARASSIRLTRRTPEGKSMRITVDLTAVGQQGAAEKDLILKPGDLIFVPESIF